MFYNHNPLMLPKDAQPECIEKSMEISILAHLKLVEQRKKERIAKKNAADAWITSTARAKFESMGIWTYQFTAWESTRTC